MRTFIRNNNSLKIKIGTRIRKYLRNYIDRLLLKNKDFSIITNNCLGGIIYHDLGLKFLSPTINLKIIPDDFVKFIFKLEDYLSIDIIEKKQKEFNYPIGLLDDITIYFVHYKSFDEAISKWNERKKRINFNNIRVMMTARDGCSLDTINRFRLLPYKKVIFDDKYYPDIEYAIKTEIKKNIKFDGYISDIVNIWGKRAYQLGGFDYINFLN